MCHAAHRATKPHLTPNSPRLHCSKLINYAVPDTIDERALNFPVAGGKELNAWEKKENQNIAINSAKSIGCQVRGLNMYDSAITVYNHLMDY